MVYHNLLKTRTIKVKPTKLMLNEKRKKKQYIDSKRHAKELEFEIGDIVLATKQIG